MGKIYVGLVVGDMKVVERINTKTEKGYYLLQWKCKCERCGAERIIMDTQLRSGYVKCMSCNTRSGLYVGMKINDLELVEKIKINKGFKWVIHHFHHSY